MRQFFQGLGDNPCSLQPALKTLHWAFKRGLVLYTTLITNISS